MKHSSRPAAALARSHWLPYSKARRPTRSPKAPHEKARAKSVIYLFMHGGVSHVDTFDYKPELQKRSGESLSVELAKTIKTSFIHDPTKAVLRGSPWEFRPGGKSGLLISDLYSNVREQADHLAVIKSCHSNVFSILS